MNRKHRKRIVRDIKKYFALEKIPRAARTGFKEMVDAYGRQANYEYEAEKYLGW